MQTPSELSLWKYVDEIFPTLPLLCVPPPLRLVGETRLVYQVFVEGGVFSCVLRILLLIYGITGIPLEASEGTKRTEQR